MDLVDIALSLKGAPGIKYSSPEEGMTPDGFDCSGFVSYCIFECYGSLPLHPETGKPLRHAREFFDYLPDLDEGSSAQRNNLVFFSFTGEMPTHMGVCIDDSRMVHKGRTKICTSSIDTVARVYNLSLLASNLRKGPNIKYDHNPIGFRRLP